MAVRWDEKRGVWRVVVNIAGPPRRRLTRDVRAPNSRAGRKTAGLEEARLAVEAAEIAAAEPVQLPGTFAAAAADWVARGRSKRGPWSPKTRKEVRYALERYILPALGGDRLDQIKPAAIERLYAAWEDAGYQPPTMRRWHGIIRAVFADAERLGDIDRSPMVRVNPAGGPAEERRIPTKDDVDRIIAAAPNPTAACYFELAVATGARRGSLTALRWRDVDLDAGVVTCVQAVAEGDSGAVLKANKGRKVYAVNIAGPGLAALRDHRRRAVETALALGLAADMDSLFVFSDDGGQTHWNLSWPSHAWLEACRRAGVAGCRLHDVRHYTATRLLVEGVAHSVVAARLGCTEANVIRTYSHRVPSPDDARAAHIMAALRSGT